MAGPFPSVELPDVGGEYIGAVSHLISAALQTAGLHVQGLILDNFQALFQSLGVLLYVFALTGAVIAYVVGGGYKKAALFLIMPVLFTWMLKTTVPGKPVLVRTGTRVQQDSREDQLNFLKRIGEGSVYESTPNVSFFFAKVDNLVTSVVQNLVAFLVDTENRKDLVNTAREGALSEILQAQASDKDFIKLVNLGIRGDCAEYTRILTEKAALSGEIEDLRRRGVRTVEQRMLDREARLEERIKFLEVNRKPVLDASLRDYLLALKDRYPSFSPPPDNKDATCSEIWQYTRLATTREAELALNKSTAGDEAVTGIPWDKVRQEVETAVTNGDPSKVSGIVGAYILKNSIRSTTLMSMVDQIQSHNPLDSTKYHMTFSHLASAEKEASILSLQYFAATIPYVQGLLLFLLSASFPFFCCLLLMPSKLSSFVVWISLWIWVKSWDVGFALIFVARDFLWGLMRWGGSMNNDRLDWNDPASVMAVINDNFDPLASLSTYYAIISALTITVPFVTAHLCLGANDLLKVFRTAFDDFSKKWQGQHAHAIRRETASKLEARIRYEGDMAGLARARRAMADGGGNTNVGPGENTFKRIQAGNGLYGRHLNAEYQKGKYQDYWFSDRAMQLKGALATFARRPVTMGHTWMISGPVVNAELNTQLEQFEAKPLFDNTGKSLTVMGGQLTGLAGEHAHKANNDSTALRGLKTPRGIISDQDGGN